MEDSCLYVWGEGVLAPALFASELLCTNRVGRCHHLPPEFAVAFVMGTHKRLRRGAAVAAGARGT